MVVIYFLSLVRADFHASISHMEKLLDSEALIIRTLDMHMSDVETRLEMMQNHLKPLKHEHSKATADVSTYLKNPINAFKLIKRLCRDWDTLAKSVSTVTSIRG